MKKSLLILSTIFALTLCSCSEEQNMHNNQENNAQTQEAEDSSSFTITWKNYDGSILEIDDNVKKGSMPSYDGDTPTRPSNKEYSYIFSNWSPSLEVVTENKTYVAQFNNSLNTYTISWDVVGQVTTETYNYGEMPSFKGSNPVKNSDAQYSYKFCKWVPEITNVTGDQLYKAEFDSVLNTYTITWDIDGIKTTETYDYGETPQYKGNDPTKKSDVQYSYEFSKWSPEISSVCGDQTYSAVFDSTLNSYTITWDVDGIKTKETYEYGEMPSYKYGLPEKEKDAEYTYEFSKWSPELSEVTGDKVYKAVFDATLNSYTITWDVNGIKTSETYNYGEIPEYKGAEPTKDKDIQYTYSFVGWEPQINKVCADQSYSAVFDSTLNSYTITWLDWDGSILKTVQCNYGTTPSFGLAPKKEMDEQHYYTFSKWSPDIKSVTCDATYTAQYEQHVSEYYTIAFDANGGTDAPDSQEKEKLDTIELSLEKPTKDGSYFMGWNNIFENKIYQPGDVFSLDKNVTLWAMWAKGCDKCDSTGVITEVLSCTNGCHWQNGKYVTGPKCSTCGATSGFVVVNGYGELCGKCWNKGIVSKGYYSVCSKCNGTGEITQKYKCNDCSGCGYYLGNAPQVDEVGPRQIILKASEGFEYSIDGTNYQESPIFTNLLPHNSYKFYQRRATNGKIPFGCSSEPLVLVTPSDTTYFITYELNGGINNSSNPSTYSTKQSSCNLFEPTKEYYDFDSWTYDGKKVGAIDPLWNCDITLVATWKASSYSITYDLDGGSASNPTTHGIETAQIVLQNPIKKGYTFIGWTGSNGSSPSLNVIIEAGNTENLHYIANWSINSYSVTVTSNDINKGTVSGGGTYEYNSIVNLFATPKDCYSFYGWYKETLYSTEFLSSNPSYSFKMGDSNINIVARWQPISYSIYYELNGGENSSLNPANYNIESNISLNEASKIGCTFSGWTDQAGNPVPSIQPGMSGDLTLTANWSINSYDVNLYSSDINKGVVSGAGSYYYGSDVTVVATPLDNCVFMGWYSNSKCTNLISKEQEYTFKMPAETTNLYSKFFTSAEEDEYAHKYMTRPIVSSDGKTITYGLYPQTNINDTSTLKALNALTEKESNGWYLYEGDYYAKLYATPCNARSKFDNGLSIVKSTKYWFKCEPIIWNVLSNNDGDYCIVSSVLLDAHCYNSESCNYKSSDIRTWLNTDFYSCAFALEDNHIQTTTVDNSSGYHNYHSCENTEDKVFLLSYKDYTDSSYGFSTSTSESTTRYCKTTDWARARGASYYDNIGENRYMGSYWTRSLDTSEAAWCCSNNGYLVRDSVNTAHASVRPGISVKIA